MLSMWKCLVMKSSMEAGGTLKSHRRQPELSSDLLGIWTYCAPFEVSEGNEKCNIENWRKTVLCHRVVRKLAELFSAVDRKAEVASTESDYLLE